MYVIVSTDIYPHTGTLFTSVTGRQLTEAQSVYNYRHSRARGRIEDTFGILRARWRMLGAALPCTPEKAGHIVHACVALHNYLMYTDASNAPAARYTRDSNHETFKTGKCICVILDFSSSIHQICLTGARAVIPYSIHSICVPKYGDSLIHSIYILAPNMEPTCAQMWRSTSAPHLCKVVMPKYGNVSVMSE